MRKIIALSLVGALLIAAGALAQEQEQKAENPNLIQNPGFETAREKPKKNQRPVAHWSKAKKGTEWCEDVVHTGKRSAKTQTPKETEKPGYVNWATGYIPVSGRVRVSAWIKTENVVQGAKPWHKAVVVFTIHDKDKKSVRKLSNGHKTICYVAGTTDWKQYKWEGDLPPEVQYIRLQCVLSHATGTAWFDDIEVVQVPPKTK